MVTEEKAKRAAKKRKATYLGNSARSKRRWRQEGKKTIEAGFPSVTNFFQKQTKLMEQRCPSEFREEVSNGPNLIMERLLNFNFRKAFQMLGKIAIHMRAVMLKF